MFFNLLPLFHDMWTISGGSGGESYTVGHAESESEAGIVGKPLKNEIYISNEVKMPLKVRKFETGDFFYPYGMIGKKKVSKFFKDEKLSIFDKQNKWILTDANNQIIWIIGMRVDRRLIKTDGECLKISI